MASKVMQRCSASLVIKEMQNNEITLHTHWNCYYQKSRQANQPTTITTTSKTENSKCWRGCREIRTLVHCCWKMESIFQIYHCRKRYGITSKNSR